MDSPSALVAAFASFLTGAAGIIGGVVAWRKASSEATVRAALTVEERLARQDARMDAMQVLVDRYRRRERVLVQYVYRLQRLIPGEVPPWPVELDQDA